MNVAQRARNAALQIEVKKDGLSQRQDGRWALRLIIHPNDMPAALSLAPMGTRYIAALVEVGDDEQPVEHGREVVPDNPQRESAHKTGAGDGKRQWSELSPAQQAGIRCNQPSFRRFLAETGSYYGIAVLDREMAEEEVRARCGVRSRAYLNTDGEAANAWHDLDVSYLAWERVQ